MEELKKDVEHLEGIVIDWSSKHWKKGEKERVLVSNIDYDIGVTMVLESDHEDYFGCFPGPSSPDAQEAPLYVREEHQETWDDDWNILVDMLEAGYFNVQEIPSESGGPSFMDFFGDNQPDADSCSFR